MIVCSLCDRPIKTALCPHPWGKGFELWPPNLLDEVRAKVPKGFEDPA